MIDDMIDDDDKMPSRLDQTSDDGESDDGMGGTRWAVHSGKSKKKKKKPLTPSSVCSCLRPHCERDCHALR